MKNDKAIFAAVATAAFIIYIRSMKKQSTGTREYPNPTATARGYRNNNPLNIIMTSTVWQGMIPNSQNTDGRFVQFTNMVYGFRAALRNIRTSILDYKTTTVQQIIYRWAPPSDGNNTAKYVTDVCKIAGFQPTTVISPSNMQQMCNLVKAMAFCENGYFIANIDAVISDAWSLYTKSL